MKFVLSVAVALVLCVGNVLAQQPEHCGADKHLRTFLADPANLARFEQGWQEIESYNNSPAANQSRSVIITIPVVFHVIHSGQAVGTGLNISDAQIQSQIDVLNECYRKRNADTALVPSWFKSRIADIEVEFCLARRDPNGNPSTGITRHNFPNASNNFDTNIKPVTQWNPAYYMNVWTTVLNGQILGYATFPNGGPLNEDGIVLDYRYVGKAPANPFPSNYTLGKTCVHEAGHWLGLFHTFQDSCSGTDPLTCNIFGDRVCDTPPTKEANYGSPSLNQNTCTETPVDELDMWMDYMDYVNDENLQMFTTGQKDIIRGVLNTSRLSIQLSLGCTDTTTAFSYSGTVVDEATNQPVANAKVLLDGSQDYETTADANGNFTLTGVYEGPYDIYAGKWGYRTKQYKVNEVLIAGSPAATIPIQNHHYYDDFLMNFNWQVSSTASSGQWVRDVPQGTYYQSAACNPSQDYQSDYGNKCYVTGNGTTLPSGNDVDAGTVTLTSPQFDLSGYTDPYIRYKRWFYDGSESGSQPDDNMRFRLNNGSSTVVVENVTTTDNAWTAKEFRIADFVQPSATMRFIVDVSDLATGNTNIVEGGLDMFEVLEAGALGVNETKTLEGVQLYPNPGTGLLHIALPAQQLVNIRITNMVGALVTELPQQQTNGQALQVDLSAQPQGIYFVTVSNGDSEKTLKFCLQR
ncbi:MAG: M43 family zinc metalloprotease [Chitinophagales bacterium]